MDRAAQPVSIDSDNYRHTFWGILNDDGKFWTPLAFDSRQSAQEYLAAFVRKNSAKFASMIATHKIVPVRVQLSTIPSPAPDQGEK